VKEYDLFVPLYYNDGTPIESRKLRRISDRLVSQFDGYTYFPQPARGVWKSAGVTYRDEIVIYRVVSSRVRAARRFFRELKQKLKAELRQEDILIIERDMQTL
jgi:hypothetical protein